MAGDISGCYEMSSGGGGFFRFDTGKLGADWDVSDGDYKVIGKDGTNDLTGSTFYLEQLFVAGCGTGMASVGLLTDGSTGTTILGVPVNTGGDGSEPVYASGAWDFKDDPVRCLTAESTLSLCVTCDGGFTRGSLKGYWGPPPSD
jgi:hypothetical protein